MADEGFDRKLAAILSADVEGYSRLMDDDEEATVRTLTSYRSAISDRVEKFRGRVVDSPGDNILAEFKSVVDSVNCAVEIQRELAERNEELPDNRKMQFRIGVNLGDVIEEEGRIYGDGVNIAARVESLAEAGGICISGRAHTQVENKLELEYEDLGKHDVKNISRPIQVYRVLSYPGAAAHRVVQAKKTLGRKWRKIGFTAAAIVIVAVALGIWQFYAQRPDIEPASMEKMAFPLPDKPSIAVLPFENMSGDPEQQYFSDGITEQIITSISKVPYIFVIARQSSFAFRDKQLTVQQIAQKLGVRYILEGSLQRSSERIRINAQLIDAKSGHHIWAENYDRILNDIFAVQDDICKNIMVALQVKLTMGEMARIYADTVNTRAYEKYIQGLEHYWLRTKEGSRIAIKLFQEAIAIDSEYAGAYILLGFAYLDEVFFLMTKTPSESIAKAEAMVQKAATIEGFMARENNLLGLIYVVKKDYDKAIASAEKAIEQMPSNAGSYLTLGVALRSNGQYEESISSIRKALQLNPVRPVSYLTNLAWAYLGSQQYEQAIANVNETIERNPDDLFAYMGLTVAYWATGLEDQAKQAAKHILRINPKFTVSYYEKRPSHKDRAFTKQVYDAWRKAGLPE